jgi:hypothetical protein
MKIYVALEVPDNFESSLSMQPIIEEEIKADRWSWHTSIPKPQSITNVSTNGGVKTNDLLMSIGCLTTSFIDKVDNMTKPQNDLAKKILLLCGEYVDTLD